MAKRYIPHHKLKCKIYVLYSKSQEYTRLRCYLGKDNIETIRQLNKATNDDDGDESSISARTSGFCFNSKLLVMFNQSFTFLFMKDIQEYHGGARGE